MSLASLQTPPFNRPSFGFSHGGPPHYHMDRGSSDFVKSEYNQQGLHPQTQYSGYPGSGPDNSSSTAPHYPPPQDPRAAPYAPVQPRGPPYGEYINSPRNYQEPQGRYHPEPTSGGMQQPVNPAALPPLSHTLHRPPESEGTDDGSSIAAPSPSYPPAAPYSPYGPPPGHEMQPGYHQGGPYHQQAWGPGYGQPSPQYNDKRRKQSRDLPAAPPHPLSHQVYSFVPIPGAAQHKRPRRRYEEIERMYKCGWNGCEKAYGTLNHLNAHVTMQSHGSKRTPEEFKEIRKEWKARKKEEELSRKAAEEEAARARGYDAPPQESAPPQPGPGGQYGMPRQLPPLGYQQPVVGGPPPHHYPPPPTGMDPLQYGSQQMYPYPPTQYQAPQPVYQPRPGPIPHENHEPTADEGLEHDQPGTYPS